MSKGQSLQEPFLNALRKDRVPVSIFLVNGIKLQGQIESFDQFVIVLRDSVNQMIYKSNNQLKHFCLKLDFFFSALRAKKMKFEVRREVVVVCFCCLFFVCLKIKDFLRAPRKKAEFEVRREVVVCFCFCCFLFSDFCLFEN